MAAHGYELALVYHITVEQFHIANQMCNGTTSAHSQQPPHKNHN